MLLKPGTIDSWRDLEKPFLDKFSTARKIPKTRRDLANIKQREDETLLAYLGRFKHTYNIIEEISQDTAITCFEGGFRSKMLFIELQLCKPKTIGKIFWEAQKVTLVEDNLHGIQNKRKERHSEIPPRDQKGKNRTRKTKSLTLLNISKENPISIIKQKYRVYDPPPMRTQNVPAKDKLKYCDFHWH